jgi:hypothetical protein
MKNKITNHNKVFALLILSITLFSSCSEENNFNPNVESVPESSAKVKFQNVAIGPAGVNFSVNWFLNDVKTTAVSVLSGLPLGIGYGGQYPAAINYALVPSGNLNMKVEIPATTTVAASTLFTSPLVVEAGKNYTTFVVGTSPTYSAYTVADDLTVADPTKAYIRFLNVISNSPSAGYDLSIKELNSNAVIYSGIHYLGGANSFIPITPVTDLESINYEIQLRAAGTTTVVAKTTLIPRKGRVYTFFSYGYDGGMPTSKNIPVLTYHTNK